MKELLIEQRHGQKLIKRWKVPPRMGFKVIGSSTDSDIRLQHMPESGVLGVIEFDSGQWGYRSLNETKASAFSPLSTEPFEISICGHSLHLSTVVTSEIKKPQSASESGSHSQKLIFLRKNGKLISSQMVSSGENVSLKLGDQEVVLSGANKEPIQRHGEFSIEEYYTSLEKSQFYLKIQDFFDKFSRRSLLFIPLMTLAIFLLAFWMSPQENLKVEESAPVVPVYQVQVKPKKAPGALSALRAQQKNKGEQKNTKGEKATLAKSLKNLGLNKLMGKISKRARQNSKHLKTKGSTAKTAKARVQPRMGALRSKLKKNWNSWGNQKQKVQTLGVGGGQKTGKLGTQLSDKGLGSGGVDLLEDESEVIGGLDRDVIANYIQSQLGHILYCYERQLSASPNLFGKLELSFIIGSTGNVVRQSILKSSLKNSSVEGCILGKVAQWKFPVPKGGTKVEVTYPFLFKSTK